MKLALSSKFVLRLLSLLDILFRKALSTIVFLNEMTYFCQFSPRISWNRSLATSDLFLCLHNQFLYILLSHNKDYRCVKYLIHEINRNEWLVLSVFQQGLSQNFKNRFERFLKKTSFWDWHLFMWESLEILNVLRTSILKQIFWKTETLSENWGIVFWLKVLIWKTQHFHTKLPSQKPMFRQIR